MGMTLALVGCGAIGSSLLKGWLTLPDSKNRFNTFWVIAPHKENVEPYLNDTRVKWCVSPEALPSSPDIIVFAIKPFQLEEALPHYKTIPSLIISVASGKPLAFYEKHFSPNHSIVRAMPNTPISIHQGIIGLLANPILKPSQKELVEMCFSGLGFCPWLTSDEEIDKLTAISGSGPAYVFLMIEALSEAAESLGFDKKRSLELALHTFVGSSLFALNAPETPDVLRAHVTSPKGTTAAALSVLEDGGFNHLIEAAVKAAFTRAQELAQ